jgi:hypothetical protein
VLSGHRILVGVNWRMRSRETSESGPPQRRRAVYVDADGAVVTNPAHAAGGEIVEDDGTGNEQRRTWFRIEEVELDWLPVRESAFLLWVLALLATAWLAIGLVLHFT